MGIRTYLCAALLVFSSISFADELAIGLATPSPTGLTGKLWKDKEIAYDIVGAWDTGSEKVYFHFDYLIHDYNKFNLDGNPMPFYYGYGARFKEEANTDTIMGLRMPIGVSYFIQNAPFEVFGELAPRVDVAPSTNFGLDVMIGVRFRINELEKQQRERRTDPPLGEAPLNDEPPPVPNAPGTYRGY